MSDSKPNRRWFQIHLSTVVALTIVAGIILGVNFTNRMPPPIPNSPELFHIDGMLAQYGWPIIAEEIWQTVIRSPGEPVDLESKWNRNAVIVDSLVAIGILFTVVFLSESIIQLRITWKP